MSAYNTTGPECPKCGYVTNPDVECDFNEYGYEMKCVECETKFQVYPNVSWSWRTKEIKQ